MYGRDLSPQHHSPVAAILLSSLFYHHPCSYVEVSQTLATLLLQGGCGYVNIYDIVYTHTHKVYIIRIPRNHILLFEYNTYTTLISI